MTAHLRILLGRQIIHSYCSFYQNLLCFDDTSSRYRVVNLKVPIVLSLSWCYAVIALSWCCHALSCRDPVLLSLSCYVLSCQPYPTPPCPIVVVLSCVYCFGLFLLSCSALSCTWQQSSLLRKSYVTLRLAINIADKNLMN